MTDNNGCKRKAKVVCQSGSSVCIGCWQRENNSSGVRKTEEGFSSAGTVLTPLSQSGLVAKCAVNLPLCVAEWERGTEAHTCHRSKVHSFKEKFR